MNSLCVSYFHTVFFTWSASWFVDGQWFYFVIFSAAWLIGGVCFKSMQYDFEYWRRLYCWGYYLVAGCRDCRPCNQPPHPTGWNVDCTACAFSAVECFSIVSNPLLYLSDRSPLCKGVICRLYLIKLKFARWCVVVVECSIFTQQSSTLFFLSAPSSRACSNTPKLTLYRGLLTRFPVRVVRQLRLEQIVWLPRLNGGINRCERIGTPSAMRRSDFRIK